MITRKINAHQGTGVQCTVHTASATVNVPLYLSLTNKNVYILPVFFFPEKGQDSTDQVLRFEATYLFSVCYRWHSTLKQKETYC